MRVWGKKRGGESREFGKKQREGRLRTLVESPGVSGRGQEKERMQLVLGRRREVVA
jgi:hypothetical protein